jgi:hypothetical protein
MKFVIVIAASVASAGLVLPTVTQGQTREVLKQEAPTAAASATKLNA